MLQNLVSHGGYTVSECLCDSTHSCQVTTIWYINIGCHGDVWLIIVISDFTTHFTVQCLQFPQTQHQAKYPSINKQAVNVYCHKASCLLRFLLWQFLQLLCQLLLPVRKSLETACHKSCVSASSSAVFHWMPHVFNRKSVGPGMTHNYSQLGNNYKLHIPDTKTTKCSC